MIWAQNYNPLGSAAFSSVVASLPIVLLLGSIALLRLRTHFAAILGLAAALAVAAGAYRMPTGALAASAVFGAAFGFFPIGWIILNILFLYQLNVRKGAFTILRQSLAAVAPDPRIQVILIAFSFGGFIEGMAGFGTPVAITSAILIQLGFRPLHACGLALIANTAPVAFGSLGIPITTLEKVADLDAIKLSAMVGRQLPFFSLLIPFWVVVAYSGWRGMLGVWPAALTAGVAFAVPQFLVSNFHGPWLVDVISGACSIGALVLLLRFWKPKTRWPLEQNNNLPACDSEGAAQTPGAGATPNYSKREIFLAWLPWVVLTCFLLFWGLPQTRKWMDTVVAFKLEMPFLHQAVQRMPPVAPVGAAPEPAIFNLNILSATGTGILLTAAVVGLTMGFSLREMWRTYVETVWRARHSLLTIAAMLALGNVTKYSGADATLGLMMAQTGVLYPFFGTLLGWLGVALTGSDTSSNVLFGSLQRITAEQTGISPVLMGAANSSGGVMGKMIDAQSIVVASTATNWFGHEGDILRYVFFHSVALAVLMGLLVLLQAYLPPFSAMVVR